MRVRVKICGITRLEDAQAAVAAGADALGFMFYDPSPRRVAVEEAAALIRELPPLVARVGVFVNAAADFIRSTAQHCGLDAVQLHGEESPDFCRGLGLPVIKALRLRGPETLTHLLDYSRTAAWLLDAYVPDRPGGTGTPCDWTLAARAVELGRPVILAGGLTAANVASAIEQVRPYAVDVSSGVERTPGRKDPGALRAFLDAVRSVTLP